MPIAIGILLSSEQVLADVSEVMFLGELSLDGGVRHAQGILPMVALAREKGLRTVIVPAFDAREAALVEGIDVIPVNTLSELIAHLRGDSPLPYCVALPLEEDTTMNSAIDLTNVKGQEHSKRALGVDAAEGHNMLLLWTHSLLPIAV